MRQKAVSPILRELVRLIEAGSINSDNFSWENVIPLCGDMTHAYGKNLKNALAKQSQSGDFAMNLQIFCDTIKSMKTPRLTLEILCDSISQYLAKNPPPTR